MPTLVVKPRSRMFHGHDWVYGAEVLKLAGNPEDGTVVHLLDNRGKSLGSAIYNSRSQIVARRFSRQKQDLDADFFHRRITLANRLRDRRGLPTEARRMVWSEADGLPGLVIDRYGPVFVVQALTLAMDRALPLITAVLVDEFAPLAVVARNDAPVRKAEGMEPGISTLHGTPQPVEVIVAGMRFEIDPLTGQKTGFYLDQAANYSEVAAFSSGRAVLDCFSNQGAFAIACALAGAAEVTAIDASESACNKARHNAERNGVKIHVECLNAFDLLKQSEAAGKIFGLIILDPPTFTRSKGRQSEAMRGYKELHLRALKMLAPEGVLATFCCSHHISEDMFLESVVDASVDARRSVTLVKRLGPSPDHPFLPHVPETGYLKGFLLEALPGR